MSNDELQKAIDDITSGDAAATAAAAEDNSAGGTASVTLPDDLTGAEANLNFTETPDKTTGETADIFATPPAPDTSSAMPADFGTGSFDNPAASAAPVAPEVGAPEAPLGADPLAGFDPDSVTLNATTPTAEPAQTGASTPAMPETPAPVSEITTTDSLDEKPAETASTEPVEITETKTPETVPVSSGAKSVAEEAMKELYPLLDKVPSMTDKEKFDVCMQVGEEALPNALQYAKGITDETEKAEALLKIIQSTK